MTTLAREHGLAAPPAPAAPPSTWHSLRAAVRRGVRDRRRAPLTWGGSLGASCALIVAIWPSIEHSISKAVESYPKGLKEAFGISQLNTVEAYLDAEMFSLIVPLAVAFFAVRVVVGAIALAEERGYLDTILAAPLSRRVLAAASFAIAALVSATVLLVVGALTWITSVVAGTGLSLGLMAAGIASVWSLAMFFAGLAVLATGFLHRSATVTAVATGTLVGMYVIDLVGKIASGLGWLRWASVFKYYGKALQDGLDPLAFVGLPLVGVALAVLGALLFERRDVL